jgi:hypothetical protein
VYADWLEEHGEPARAQFIRLQLARAALEDRTLELGDSAGGPEVAAALARGRGLTGLTVLRLDRTGLGNGGVIALAGIDRWPGLQSLWLNQNRVGSKGLTALARSPHFPGLRTLELCHNQVTSSGAQALAQAPWARGLG